MRSSSIKKIKHTARQFHSRTLGRKQVVILLLSFTILFSLWLAYQYSIIPVGSNFLQPVSPEPSVIADSDAADAQPAKFRMCFTGDNILGTFVHEFHAGVDPYKYIKSEMLANCDFLVGNLETALATPGVGSPNLYKNFAFLAPLAALDWMQGVNMTVVSLANNHALDYGGAALLDELRLLPEHNILGFGAGGDTGAAFTPKYYIYQDTVIGFVGVNGVENSVTNPSYNSPGNAYFDYNKIVSAIKTAKENADIVVVFPHWGTEGSDYANSFQKSWAQTFVNAGADLVVGAGPHKVQEYVEVGGKPVYYSLGNFAVFGFYYSPGGSVGAYMQATVSNKQIISTQQTKVLISYYGLPVKLGENPADPYPGDAFGPL